jgi:hypothetical protein
MGRSVRRWRRWSFVVSFMLCAAHAALQPVAAQDVAAQAQAAEALFRQAQGLMQQGELEEACEKFAASQALEPGLGTLLYLGDCYERAGRFASAFSTFRAAAQLAEKRSDTPRYHLASVRASALQPRVPTLEIRTAPAAQAIDLQITINGSPLHRAELNRPLARDAGRQEIRFSAPGYAPFVSRLELRNGPGGSASVTIPRLVPLRRTGMLARASGAAPEAMDAGGGVQRVMTWIVAGTGLALTASAGVLSGVAAARNRDSGEHCDPVRPNRCGPEGVRLRNDAKSMARAATVTGLLGGLGLAGGLGLYLSLPEREAGAPDAALLVFQGSLL